MRREELLRRLEERLARGEISEETYREIKARYDAMPEEPEEPPEAPEEPLVEAEEVFEEPEAEPAPSQPESFEDIGALIEEQVGSIMDTVGRRLEDTLDTEEFEARMEDVGKRVRQALSQMGPRFEAGGRKVVISGSGVVAFDAPIEIFKCAGSGRVTSDLNAKQVRISGSCRIEGACDAQEFHSSGSSRVQGNLRAQEFHSSGSTRVAGDLRAQEIHSSGGLKVEGSILDTQELRTTGSLAVVGSVGVQEFTSKGSFRIGEGLTAQQVDVRLRGTCRVPFIRATHVDVRGGRRRGDLRVETVEGEDVYLEDTRANLVRGKEVRIGPYCSIGVVEAEKLEVHETSTVKEQRRPGED